MIIGVGPPRSGTKSLARLLDLQGIKATHEAGPRVPWNPSGDDRQRAVAYADKRGGADVAYKWLPVLSALDGPVIGLVRQPSEWLESVLAHFDKNVLTPSEDQFHRGFPSYEAPRRERWRRYRRDFYHRLFKARPGVTMVQTEALECDNAQEVVFDAAGIAAEDRRYLGHCHHNKR